MITLNNYILNISKKLFISYNTSERTAIQNSINSIKYKLNDYFKDEIDDIIIFGSYTRGTIIPRKYDKYSDVDIMIIFNTDDYYEKNPETYRNNLKSFVDRNYVNSFSKKDLPSVILELSNIKFDLIPAVIENYNIYIPDSGGSWQETNPNDFNEELVNANQKYNNIVKPIVRLFKYWNTSNNKPFDSFELEKIIADMNFNGDNYQEGFFYAIDKLSCYYKPDYVVRKVDTLKNNKAWVEEYLERDNEIKAKEWLHKILP